MLIKEFSPSPDFTKRDRGGRIAHLDLFAAKFEHDHSFVGNLGGFPVDHRH